jgi:hypothetical protein
MLVFYGLFLKAGAKQAVAAGAGGATITVNGRGEVRAAPDCGQVRVGVATQSASAREAQLANDRAVEAVIAAVKAQGVTKENIQTSEYGIWPEYNEKGQLWRYRINHNLTVEVKAIQKLGAVLDAAVAAGANQSCSISFDRSDREVLEREALKKAVADARQRAEALAGAAGKSITRVVSIAEGAAQQEPPVYRSMAQLEGAGSVPVEPGELAVSAAVEVTFETSS